MDSNDNTSTFEQKELDAVKKLLEEFHVRGEKAIDELNQYLLEKNKSIHDQEEAAKKRIQKEIAALEEKGLFLSEKQKTKYEEEARKKRRKYEIQDQIDVLEFISKEKEKQREKELELLEKQKQVIELKNEGKSDEADKLQREIKIDQKKQKKEADKEQKKEEGMSYQFGDIFKDSFSELSDEIAKGHVLARTTEQNMVNAMKGVGKAITAGLNAINDAITSYAKHQTSINARLQGTNSFSNIVKELSSVAYSPLLKTEDLYSNVAEIVGQGIATNVEQRAFFATVKDGIATTFDVTSDSLKRMIRVQQNDSTAARLGMEGYLTQFLNTYVENTEYLQSTFDNVASSLFEASAMLGKASGAGASAEFEYMVQKWLGVLTGAGMSDDTAQNIASALGQLGSGDVEALSGSNMQNLLVMAANEVGLEYAELLSDGLDAQSTNKLMSGVVSYLQKVGEEGTNIVKNQLGKMFGVTTSDLIAVANLSKKDIEKFSNDSLSYDEMYGELANQFSQLYGRMGLPNVLENLFNNLTYQTGMNIASNPVSYGTWKITDLIQGVTGGINIPFINAMGFGVDLNTSVENLMKLGLVGVSTLGNIGKIAGGLGSVGDGASLLKALDINSGTAKIKKFGGYDPGQGGPRNGPRKRSKFVSENSYVGNSDSDAYYKSTLNAANDEGEEKIKQKAKQYKDPVVEYLDQSIKFADYIKKHGTYMDKMLANQRAILSAVNGIGGFFGLSRVNAIEKDFMSEKPGSSNNSLPNTQNQTPGYKPPMSNSSTEIGTAAIDIINQISTSENNLSVNIQKIPEILTLMNNSLIELSPAILEMSRLTSESQKLVVENSNSNTNYEGSITSNQTQNNSSSSTTTVNGTTVTTDEIDSSVSSGNLSVSNSNLADIGNYLSEISFGEGFKSVVDNIDLIAKKMDAKSSSSGPNEGDITGFTNPSKSEEFSY